MTILFTAPNDFPGEAACLNRMLAAHPSLIVHLRKPELGKLPFERSLAAIQPRFHPRVVIHQYHELSDAYDLKGVHFTERHRAEHARHPQAVSTSFHTLSDARNSGTDYDYFFCSPVFPSISKQGYEPSENWNIAGTPEAFREKAVALGGIDPATIGPAKQLGFRHFALLGAVWQAADPAAALDTIYRAL